MFREAEQERVLTINSHAALLNLAKSWLIRNRSGVIHTNREINTGWKQMKFDFSVTTESALCLYLCRSIFDTSCINRLSELMAEVDRLYQSGIKQDGLLFGVELIISDTHNLLSKAAVEQLKGYSWLKHVEKLKIGDSK